MCLFRVFMGSLTVVLSLGLSACSTEPMSQPLSQTQVDEQRAEIRDMVHQTLAQVFSQYPNARRQIERAAGYAVFSDFGLKFMFMGSATGKGMAVNNATQQETFMRMIELQPGYGFGAQQFRVAFIFETLQAFDQFVYSGWEFGGSAMATATTQTQQMGSQLGVTVSPGVLMYQLNQQGAIVGVSITGAKYYPDDSLN